MHVLLHPLDDVIAQIFAGKELVVDEAVVVVEVLVRADFDVQALDRRLDSFLADAEAGFLIILLRIHQLAEREHGHHDLLRKGQACRVVQRDVAAVRYDAVDEGELTRLERERAITLVQLLLYGLGMLRDYFVENIVLVDRDGTQAPAGAAEIFAVGIDAEGVPRELTHERAEARYEGSVDVIRQQDEIRSLLKHGPDLLNRLGRECNGNPVARIDNEE